MWINCRRAAVALSALAFVAFGPQARADTWLTNINGGDPSNFAVLYEGNGGKTLSINNGSGPAGLAINGNVGIAGTGALQVSGPLVINGNVEFGGTPNPATNPSGGNIVPT